MFNLRNTMILAFAVALTGACDADVEREFDPASDGETALRPGAGFSFNTSYAGNHALDHVDLTGAPYQGVSLMWIEHDNGVDPREQVDPSTINVIDGELLGVRFDNQQLTHTDWGDTLWLFYIEGVGEIEVTMVPRSIGATKDQSMPWYDLYWAFPGENSLPMCPKEADDPLEATVYRGISIDYGTGEVSDHADMLYFGCHNGAVGKAYWWGYGYHVFHDIDPVASLDWFTAAIRMIRADILGDATSYTNPGNEVAPNDNLGLRAGFPSNSIDEAVWDENGAICADSARDGTALGSISGAPPTCASLGGAYDVMGSKHIRADVNIPFDELILRVFRRGGFLR